jgi:hypothetical protein
MALNVANKMNSVRYILETSLVKTLASKHRVHVSEIYKKYQIINRVDNTRAIRVIIQRPNKDPLFAVFGGFSMQRKPEGLGTKDFSYDAAWYSPKKSVEVIQRLELGRCELCETYGPAVRIEMHHIRHMKDLDRPGQNPKPEWQRIMSAHRRKTLAVCEACHNDIHAGRYDGPSLKSFTGEPDASKGARSVRRGAVGKGATP